MFFLLFVFSVLSVVSAQASGLVINEFLADPQGADSGQEFVELLNNSDQVVNLQGLSLEFANGSVGAVWQVRWQVLEDYWLGPGERFLLVDRNWLGDGPGQVEVWLGLQNGPDALRICRQAVVLDLVGYGPLTDQELFEGAPSPLRPGYSLSRKPDGYDSNHNQTDFVLTLPTPGEPNFLDYQLRLKKVILDPPCLPALGPAVLLEIELENSGLLEFPPVPMAVGIRDSQGNQHSLVETIFTGCPSGGHCSFLVAAIPDETGMVGLFLEMHLSGAEEPLLVELGDYQIGYGPLFLTEVMAAPENQQGEWVEIQAGNQEVMLGDFFLRDEESSWRKLPEMDLAAGQLVVVAQDSAALMHWEAEILAHNVVLDCQGEGLASSLRQFPGAWPTLNNHAPENRSFADRVHLGDPNQVVLDQVTLPDRDGFADGSGHSWERRSHQTDSFLWNSWRSCVAIQGGTPGCLNSVGALPGIVSGLVVEPPVLDSDAGVVATHIRFSVSSEESVWHLQIYSLWGRLIRDLGGSSAEPGCQDFIWDGRDDQGRYVDRGAYVIVLFQGSLPGAVQPTAKVLVAVR